MVKVPVKLSCWENPLSQTHTHALTNCRAKQNVKLDKQQFA